MSGWLAHECRGESFTSGVENRFRYSSSMGSRGRWGWMVCRYERGTSFGADLSVLRGRGAFDGGVSGEENIRGDAPGSEDEEEDWVYGDGSR